MLDKIIIVFILIILIGLFLYLINYYRKKSKKEYFRGQDDLFKLILASGFASKVNSFKFFNEYVEEGNIVFVGDSITQDYNVYEFFNNLKVFNRGIGGDTTVGLLTRLNESIFDLKPKVIVLLIGTNDLAILKSKPIEVYNNIKKIIEEVYSKLPNSKIILQSIYPISRENNPKIDLLSVNNRYNGDIDQINNLIKTINNVIYIDVNKHLKDEFGNLKLEYTIEGLHISPIGYKQITKLLEPVLIENLN